MHLRYPTTQGEALGADHLNDSVAAASATSADLASAGGTVASVAVLAALVGFGTPASHTYRVDRSHIRDGSSEGEGAGGGGPMQWQQWLLAQPDGASAGSINGHGAKAPSGVVRRGNGNCTRQKLSKIPTFKSSHFCSTVSCVKVDGIPFIQLDNLIALWF